MLKRNKLPAFKKLPYTFDVKKIQQVLKNMPDINDLTVKNGYGDKVGSTCSNLQSAFGLKFNTLEEAYSWLEDNNISKENQIINGKKFAPDFRNYIQKSYDNKYEVNASPYKQIGLTEYNPDAENRVYDKKIPKSRLDERHYNKPVDWILGTYIEDVLNTFIAEHTRARVAVMNPGTHIKEHIDYDTDYSVRYHIPLETNNNCGFYVIDKDGNKRIQQMNSGECWFINQGFKHSAWNYGETPRYHIVISCLGQDDLFVE